MVARQGAYGLTFVGLKTTPYLAQLTHPTAQTVTLRQRPLEECPWQAPFWSDEQVLLQLAGSSRASVDASAGTATLWSRRRWPAALMVHPFLSVPALAWGWWGGGETIHGGAVLGASGAWVIMGKKGRGKTTLLAALARRGATVLSDDLSVITGGQVLRGPRCLDLRPSAAAQLGAECAGKPRGRCRMQLGAAPERAPLAGFVSLSWGDAAVTEVTPAERLRRLTENAMVERPRRDGARFDLVSLPMLDVRRLRDWRSLDASVDAVIGLLGLQPGPLQQQARGRE